MGTSKTEIFTQQQNELARLAKALGHPARIAIIEFLVKTNACYCGDIVEEIGLAQATVSQHLKELKSAGIIKGNIEGTSVCYCINPESWNKLTNNFNSLFSSVSERCC